MWCLRAQATKKYIITLKYKQMLNFTSEFLSNIFNHITYNRHMELIAIAAKQLFDKIVKMGWKMLKKGCIKKKRFHVNL